MKPKARRRLVAGAAGPCVAAIAFSGSAVIANDNRAERVPQAKNANVKDGTWTGTAVDDKYGSVGTIRFQVKKDGRLVENLRVENVSADCPSQTPPTFEVRLPRAKVKPSGLMRGHYVFGAPGQGRQSLVSYDARLRRTTVTDGRIYQNNDLNNLLADQCEVPSVTFTAAHRGG
jgi:hypothetical protein